METEELVSKMFMIYIFTTKSRQVYNRKQVKGLYVCKLIQTLINDSCLCHTRACL